MSAAMDSSTRTQEIFIPLVNEGTDVFRPTLAVKLADNLNRVLATKDYDSTDEKWQFPPGTTVECAAENRNGYHVLVARNRIGSLRTPA